MLAAGTNFDQACVQTSAPRLTLLVLHCCKKVIHEFHFKMLSTPAIVFLFIIFPCHWWAVFTKYKQIPSISLRSVIILYYYQPKQKSFIHKLFFIIFKHYIASSCSSVRDKDYGILITPPYTFPSITQRDNKKKPAWKFCHILKTYESIILAFLWKRSRLRNILIL